MIVDDPTVVTLDLLDIEVTHVAQVTRHDATTQGLFHRGAGHTEVGLTRDLLFDRRMARGAEARMAAAV